jgi:hypothetical protein
MPGKAIPTQGVAFFILGWSIYLRYGIIRPGPAFPLLLPSITPRRDRYACGCPAKDGTAALAVTEIDHFWTDTREKMEC